MPADRGAEPLVAGLVAPEAGRDGAIGAVARPHGIMTVDIEAGQHGPGDSAGQFRDPAGRDEVEQGAAHHAIGRAGVERTEIGEVRHPGADPPDPARRAQQQAAAGPDGKAPGGAPGGSHGKSVLKQGRIGIDQQPGLVAADARGEPAEQAAATGAEIHDDGLRRQGGDEARGEGGIAGARIERLAQIEPAGIEGHGHAMGLFSARRRRRRRPARASPAGSARSPRRRRQQRRARAGRRSGGGSPWKR